MQDTADLGFPVSAEEIGHKVERPRRGEIAQGFGDARAEYGEAVALRIGVPADAIHAVNRQHHGLEASLHGPAEDDRRTPVLIGITGDDQILKKVSVVVVFENDAAAKGRNGAEFLGAVEIGTVEQGEAEGVVNARLLVEEEAAR